MSFYLSEKMPSQYHRFLINDGNRSDFMAHSKQQRAVEFAGAFGSDTAGLEAQMKRFFVDLKMPGK